MPGYTVDPSKHHGVRGYLDMQKVLIYETIIIIGEQRLLLYIPGTHSITITYSKKNFSMDMYLSSQIQLDHHIFELSDYSDNSLESLI